MNEELEEDFRKFLEEENENQVYGINPKTFEMLNSVLNYIDNSISKEVIKEKIEELRNMKVEGEVFTTAVNFTIKFLQELLEQK